jgi:hypothetical protein
MEKLNYDPEDVKEYIFQVQDLRVAANKGKKGVRPTVTGMDLCIVKVEFRRLENLDLKRRRAPSLKLRPRKKQKTDTVREFPLWLYRCRYMLTLGLVAQYRIPLWTMKHRQRDPPTTKTNKKPKKTTKKEEEEEE